MESPTPPVDIKKLPLEALRAAALIIKRKNEELKAEAKMILDELLIRHSSDFNSRRKVLEKPTGDFCATLCGVKLKSTIETKVTWDQDKLLALGEKIGWDEWKSLVEIEYKVSEKNFKGADAALKAVLQEARTVKYSDLKITFVEEGPASE